MFEIIKNVAETTFDLQFDIEMLHNSFHLAIKFLLVIELLFTLLQFSHTKQW